MSSPRPIYLDHNATTPLAPEVLERMLPWLREGFGNASSIHQAGQRARRAVDDAREQVAAALGCVPKEVVFTSGGTEADNLAIRGAFTARQPGRPRVIVSATEHPAVLETARALGHDGAEVLEIPVDREGLVDFARLEEVVTPETALVSMIWANNETGVINPIGRISALCHQRGVPLHVDAVQAAGKLPIDLTSLGAALVSVSAHKLYGPKGAGALVVRKGAPTWSVQTGGHQERGRRGGTENVAAIVGFGAAMELATARRVADEAHVAGLQERLRAHVERGVPDVRVAGAGAPRLGNTLNVCFGGVESEALLMGLDLAGICASGGSACTAGSLEPSHVILAMGFARHHARGAVRFSLGRGNTEAEIDVVGALLPDLVARLRGGARAVR